MNNDPSARVTVDWVSLTYDKTVELQDVLDSWAPENERENWSKCVGAYGYGAGKERDGIRVYYAGYEHMGIHVQVSGEGCRQAEAEGLIRQEDWQTWFRTMLAESPSKFSRIDIAFDSFSGTFTVRDIKRKGKQGLLVTGWKKSKSLELLERDLITGECTGEGYVLGKGSNTQVIFYDKGAESGTGVPWVRVELRMKGKNAQDLAQHLAENGLKGIAGILKRYVNVKKRGRSKDSNVSRLKTEKWWDEFLDNAERVRLTVNPTKKEKKSHDGWVKKSEVLRMIEEGEGDLSPLFQMLRGE